MNAFCPDLFFYVFLLIENNINGYDCYFWLQGKDEFLGRSICSPMVKLTPEEDNTPKLLWYPVTNNGKASGDILFAAELILRDKVYISYLYFFCVCVYKIRSIIYPFTASHNVKNCHTCKVFNSRKMRGLNTHVFVLIGWHQPSNSSITKSTKALHGTSRNQTSGSTHCC